MKTAQTSLIKLLFPEGNCFQIPPFQRNYQWGTEKIQKLVSDIKSATFENQHWIGVALVGESATQCKSGTELGHTCMDILDGQQRFLTLRLWCTALIDEFERQNPGQSLTVRLTNRDEPVKFTREKFVDIQVHALDEDDWQLVKSRRVFKEKKFDKGNSSSVLKAYLYFRLILLTGLSAMIEDEVVEIPENKEGITGLIDYWIANFKWKPVSSQDIREMMAATVERLDISVLQHESSDEPIEVIFETLNSQREELGQFDLFRNYLLISSKQHGKEQKALYSKHLATSEKSIQNAKLNLKVKPLDRFLYDFIIGQAISSDTVKMDSTVKLFRSSWESRDESDRDVAKYLDSALTPSMNAWLAAISGGKIQNHLPFELPESVSRSISRIEEISRGPLTPLVARVIFDWSRRSDAGPTELKQELHWIESFAVRRLLAGHAFSPLRREIMSACREIFGGGKLTLKKWALTASASDFDIRRALMQTVAKDGVDPLEIDHVTNNEFYTRAGSRATRAVFDGIVEAREGQLGSRLVAQPGTRETKSGRIWVEHLYPQTNDRWLADLRAWGVDVSRMNSRLHALGNLAVIPAKIDITLSNNCLADKQSTLREAAIPEWKSLKPFMKARRWTPEAIDERTRSLTEDCLKIWKVS